MVIQTRSHSVFTLFSFIITTFVVFGNICSSYKSPDSLMNKYYSGSSISSGDRSSTIGKSNFGLCNIKRQVIDVQHEGADGRVRIPILHLDSPSLADSYYLPMNSRLKSKKSQRAILLDVGDYIVKSDGEVRVIADDIPRAGTGTVGGILRNSG